MSIDHMKVKWENDSEVFVSGIRGEIAANLFLINKGEDVEICNRYHRLLRDLKGMKSWSNQQF